MPSWAWTTLKWVGASVVMVLVVVITLPMALDQLSQAVVFGNDDGVLPFEDPEVDDDGIDLDELETTSGEAHSIFATGIRNSVGHHVGAGTVALADGGADELLIAFDPVPPDPACLTNVELEVQLLEATEETEVHVRPARVTDLSGLGDGEALPADASIDGGDPARAFTSGQPGRLRWNATIPYSIAAREADPEGDVVLSIYLPADSTAQVTFATGVELEGDRASLSWTAVAGCEDLDPEERPDELLDEDELDA